MMICDGKIEELDLRLEVAFTVSLISDWHALPDNVEEALASEIEELLADCGIPLHLAKYLFQDDDDFAEPGEVAQQLFISGRRGWFLKFAQPVYREFRHGCLQCSWGNHRTRWFYSESIEAAIQMAIAWAEENCAVATARLSEGKRDANS